MRFYQKTTSKNKLRPIPFLSKILIISSILLSMLLIVANKTPLRDYITFNIAIIRTLSLPESNYLRLDAIFYLTIFVSHLLFVTVFSAAVLGFRNYTPKNVSIVDKIKAFSAITGVSSFIIFLIFLCFKQISSVDISYIEIGDVRGGYMMVMTVPIMVAVIGVLLGVLPFLFRRSEHT